MVLDRWWEKENVLQDTSNLHHVEQKARSSSLPPLPPHSSGPCDSDGNDSESDQPLCKISKLFKEKASLLRAREAELKARENQLAVVVEEAVLENAKVLEAQFEVEKTKILLHLEEALLNQKKQAQLIVAEKSARRELKKKLRDAKGEMISPDMAVEFALSLMDKACPPVDKEGWAKEELRKFLSGKAGTSGGMDQIA